MSARTRVPFARTRARRDAARAAGALAWVLVAGLLALGELGERTRRAAGASGVSGNGRSGRHVPVVVTGEWRHAPVAVSAPHVTESHGTVAFADPKPRPKPKRPARALPKPFAALRLPASPLIMPRLAMPRVLTPRLPALRSLLARAQPGEPVPVTLSAYCLQGTTRKGTRVRPGVIAADPRVFPLSRHVELYAAGRYLGRFRVEDTGSKIKGARIDIWTPDCKDAIQFGMRSGVATMIAAGD